jgi:hypothetical protein
MDDFSLSTLHESRNEWCARLVSILTPLVIEGYKSIFDESFKLCKDNGEIDKYLMTFQNFISRVPKWNSTIIENERKRICDRSGCNYLEDLVTCVHVIQMKIMTAMRVGHKQKKIDINIPKLDDFLHKCYINVGRKIYKNVYLFEINIAPLMLQKNHRELEVIVQEAILNTIRESIPVESILKAYMDETTENEVIEEVKEQLIEEAIEQKQGETIQTTITDPEIIQQKKLAFDEVDYVKDSDNKVYEVSKAKQEDTDFRIKVLDNSNSIDDINLDLEIENIEPEPEAKLPDLLKDEIEFEVLE